MKTWMRWPGSSELSLSITATWHLQFAWQERVRPQAAGGCGKHARLRHRWEGKWRRRGFLEQRQKLRHTNSTLPLMPLISPFLWLTLYYSGNQLLRTPPPPPPRWPCDAARTYTYFCSLVVGIGLRYHLHLGKTGSEREGGRERDKG